MNPQNDREEELRRKEQELRDREHAIRLREMEAELYQQSASPADPPLYTPTRHEEPESALKRNLRKVIQVAKFFGIVIVVVVAVKIGMWLATAVMVGAVAWVVYKLFFDGDRKPR